MLNEKLRDRPRCGPDGDLCFHVSSKPMWNSGLGNSPVICLIQSASSGATSGRSGLNSPPGGTGAIGVALDTEEVMQVPVQFQAGHHVDVSEARISR